MYAAYHLRADELNDEVVQTLKNTFRQDEIVILPKAAYDEIEKIRHNAAFTEKLQQGILDIEEGRGIVKTMDELKAMEDE
jgi:transcriptional regulator